MLEWIMWGVAVGMLAILIGNLVSWVADQERIPRGGSKTETQSNALPLREAAGQLVIIPSQMTPGDGYRAVMTGGEVWVVEALFGGRLRFYKERGRHRTIL